MDADTQITASVVSHGQMRLVNTLIADLVHHAGPALKRLVVTVNIPEAEPVRADQAPFEVITLRNEHALGFGANHNRAFRHCQTGWFAILNPDLRLSDDALGGLLSTREPTDGLIAPVILNADGTAADSARRVPTPWQVVQRRLRSQTRGAEADFDWVAGMCMLLNAEAFRSLNGFDERFHLYCEDTDLCLRLQLAGWRLRHAAGVRVVHDARRDSRRSARYLAWHVESLARLWTSGVFWSYLRRRDELSPMRRSGLTPGRFPSP